MVRKSLGKMEHLTASIEVHFTDSISDIDLLRYYDCNVTTSGYNMSNKDRERKRVSEVGIYREDPITLD